LLRTLGEELISNEVVAVIELVKNAYDADATNVLIKFIGPLEIGTGAIEIIDNGHGMELETIKTVWMEPATPSKRGEHRFSLKYKRRVLGEKGIGRFASSRLANELEVITRKTDSSTEVYGLFDWRQFDDEDKYLDEVIVLWEDRAPRETGKDGAIERLHHRDDGNRRSDESCDHGTILRMSGLKQKWERQHFESLIRALTRLISPHLKKLKNSTKDPGFEVELELPDEFSEYSRKVEQPVILRHPHYLIVGNIDSNGRYSLSYRIHSQGIDENHNGQFARINTDSGRYELRDFNEKELFAKNMTEDTRLLECGPIELEIRVWDRDNLGNVLQMTSSTITDVRRDLDAVAGINIYRDGFRVLPYGEPQDDWLRLDLRRVQNPTMRLSNNQVYGLVHISAEANPRLHDQTNREGLDHNQALQDLRDILTGVLSRLETMRHQARPRRGSNKPTGGLFEPFDFSSLTKHLSKQTPPDKIGINIVNQTEKQFNTQLKEIQTVLARYQRLATLGQLIDHVLHEGRQPIAAINNESVLGIEELNRDDEIKDSLLSTTRTRFINIRSAGGVLAAAFKRMEPFGGRKRGRPSQLYMEAIFDDAVAIFSDEIKRKDVLVERTQTQTLVRVDHAELQEVFINLLQNSLYWLGQISKQDRKIKITFERKAPDQVDIVFSDSGPGVPEEIREQIFEPYFSTKPEGVGLGLSIVGEIVSDYYGGSLELLKSGPLSGACFLIRLRKRV
jgi:hypothetical protein